MGNIDREVNKWLLYNKNTIIAGQSSKEQTAPMVKGKGTNGFPGIVTAERHPED